MDSLHKHINPENLPTNYGGKLPAIDYCSKDWFPVIKEVEHKIKGKYCIVKIKIYLIIFNAFIDN